MSLASDYRAEQLRLNREAVEQLLRVFPALNLADIDRTAPGWVFAVEQVTNQHYAMSQGLAHRVYETQRAKAGLLNEVSFVLPSLNGDKLRASLTLKGPYAAKRLLSRGVVPDEVARILFGTTTGIALRHGQAGGRDTIVHAANADPKAVGWKRITTSGACRFCRFLADRGAVYRESTATFAAHDGCMCTAAAVFKGGKIGPEATTEQYIGSGKTRTAKDRARLNDALEAFEPRKLPSEADG